MAVLFQMKKEETFRYIACVFFHLRITVVVVTGTWHTTKVAYEEEKKKKVTDKHEEAAPPRNKGSSSKRKLSKDSRDSLKCVLAH